MLGLSPHYTKIYAHTCVHAHTYTHTHTEGGFLPRSPYSSHYFLYSLSSSFFSWLHCAAWGILVPRPEIIHPVSPLVEAQSLTIGPPGKSHPASSLDILLLSAMLLASIYKIISLAPPLTQP